MKINEDNLYYYYVCDYTCLLADPDFFNDEQKDMLNEICHGTITDIVFDKYYIAVAKKVYCLTVTDSIGTDKIVITDICEIKT